MKTKTYEKVTASLHVRLRPTEKATLLKKIKEADCSITEFITQFINNSKLNTPGNYKAFTTSLHLLSSDVHRIGININQVVHLMHQHKLTGDIHAGLMHQFNQLLRTYQQLLEDTRFLFQKIISNE